MEGKRKIIDLLNSNLPEPFSEEEKRILDEWVTAGNEEADETLLGDEEKMQAIEKEMLAGINERIDGRTSRRMQGKLPFLRIAASIALCCAAALFIYYLSGKGKADYITASASQGKVMQLLLPDSSVLWLNAGSTVKYPRTFGATRDVQLVNGEAFFDVRRNEQRPFRVFASGINVTVLGTSFNVKSFNNLEEAKITVASGRVQISDSSLNLGTFSRNDELIINKRSREHYTRTVESGNVIKWRQGAVNLYEVPFRELILTLENAYGISVNYDPAFFANCRTTISFHTSDNLNQVLDMVKAIYGLSYRIKEGKEVILETDQLIQPCR
ncbi:FecR family protein [Anseongella ginsenosidimutans]|uniref:FecR family protein n=1 Tax=Anseongella ginsenosidimutans TaxID=496056 RepID=A0A4V2UTB9_9SPHI|nr:FecR domain-containing protein [Anseongella ginsenosidimutans]QEC52537.1 DUF4974 domain-containing protein [Anseongella ginsenosidimutans]TCS85279.1 FecR family protein [Anseongella ginsenosidimutans]